MYRLYLIVLSFIYLNSVYPQVDLENGLIFHYPFDGTCEDVGPNGLDCISDATLALDRFNIVDAAYHFNGIDQLIHLPNDPKIKPQLPMSLSCWIKLDEIKNEPEVHGIFSNDYVENLRSGLGFTIGDDAIYTAIYSGGPTTANYTHYKKCEVDLDIDTWYHFTILWKQNREMEVWLDCENLEGVYGGNGGDLYYSDQPGKIGRIDHSTGWPDNVGFWFHGSMDDLYFWNRILTEDEVMFLDDACCDETTLETPLIFTGRNQIGSLDTNWEVSSVFSISSTEVPIQDLPTPNAPNFNWAQATVISPCSANWVSPQGLPSPLNQANWITHPEDDDCNTGSLSYSHYYYRTKFSLPCSCGDQPITLDSVYIITLDAYADNVILAVYINGELQGIPTLPGGTYSDGGEVQIELNSSWLPGENIVDILVRNNPGTPTSTNPEGLLAVLSQTADSDNDGVNDYLDLCLCDGNSIIDTNFVSLNTCNLLDTGTIISTYLTNYGCDSIVISNFYYLPTEVQIDTLICFGTSIVIGEEIYDEPGEYSQILEGSDGCDSLLIITIEEKDCDPTDCIEALMYIDLHPTLHICPGQPNLFIVAMQAACEFEYYNLKIVSKIGQVVYATKTPGDFWDGTGNFTSPMELFFYVLKYRLPGGETKKLTGMIVLYC